MGEQVPGGSQPLTRSENLKKLKWRKFPLSGQLDVIFAMIVTTAFRAFRNKKEQQELVHNPMPYGLFNKPNLMGGGEQICPPLSFMAIRGCFQYFF